uniref:Uncharacterized protein n=1 Tax=Molossus molossus TaxID=27622 RepID=A0A7J8HI51_MOLMO|nr:hypothetical protein HJG59_011078 [Molossus molossus]
MCSVTVSHKASHVVSMSHVVPSPHARPGGCAKARRAELCVAAVTWGHVAQPWGRHPPTGLRTCRDSEAGPPAPGDHTLLPERHLRVEFHAGTATEKVKMQRPETEHSSFRFTPHVPGRGKSSRTERKEPSGNNSRS